MMKTITIFTPTYNRAYCLNRCYESMLRQKNKDFIWLIIDDGSTDNTKELVDFWKKQSNGFDIQYVYKENGGMHTGYNVAYSLIETELSMNIDSDDYLTDTAIEDIIAFWKANKRDDIGGIYALDQYKSGEVVGEKYPDDLHEFHGWGCKRVYYTKPDGTETYVKIRGDKKFIGVTKIINQYPPFPVFEGEKYYQLYHKQHLIERDYSILIYNKPVCVIEYLEDGSTRNMFKQYVRNPKGFAYARRYTMQNAPWLGMRYIAATHYIAESLLANTKGIIRESHKKLLTVCAIPTGVALFCLIKWKTRNGV